MKTSNRLLLSVVLLCLAVVSYLFGSAKGIFLFIALGLVFELAFWVGLFSTGEKYKYPTIEKQ